MNKDKIKENLNKFVESNNFKKIIFALLVIFVLIFVFELGVVSGFKKATFRHNWGDNYENNFGPKRDLPPFVKDNIKDMPNANGAIGKIIKIDLPNIVVLDKDKTEKVIVVNDKTNILERKDKINKDFLTLDKYIIVIGEPNELGQIEAKLIRVIPSPDEMLDSNPNASDWPRREFNHNNI